MLLSWLRTVVKPRANYRLYSTNTSVKAYGSLQQLVNHYYPTGAACAFTSDALPARLNANCPIVSFGERPLICTEDKSFFMRELPSGRRKKAYVFKDLSSYTVLQIQKPMFIPELFFEEISLTYKLHANLQTSQDPATITVINANGNAYQTHGNFQRYLGPDWQTLLSSPNLTLNVLQELLGLLPDIAEHLIRIHQLGYRHRDIRLENMTVESIAGFVLRGHLIDFGLAKPLPEECGHTGFSYYETSPGDWSAFIKTIERILSAKLPMSPLVEHALINYCAMVRALIQYEDFASLNDLQLHREYFQPLSDNLITHPPTLH